MSFALIAEAILRVEHKLDALLRHTNCPVMPMHFIGLPCPVCMNPVDYTVDIQAGIVVRRCDCKTGKVASMLPLMPVIGDSNGNAAQSVSQPVGDDQPSRGPGRKAR